MSSATRPVKSVQPKAKRSPLVITLLIIAAVTVLLFIASQVWTEWLWYDVVDYSNVFVTRWVAQLVLFLIGGVVMGGAVYFALAIAFKHREIYAPLDPQRRDAHSVTVAQYQEAIEPLRKLITIGAPLVLGFFAGVSLAGRWQEVLLWLNGSPTGQVDPQHGVDLSFYLFTLPVLQFFVSFLIAVTVFSLIGGTVIHYIYEGVRFGAPGALIQASKPARIQLSITAAVLMLLIAANNFLARYTVLTNSGELFDGAGYTAINAIIPAKMILAGVSVVIAALFVVTAFKGTWRLPAIGVALMIATNIVVGWAYPALVQEFQVKPNEQDREAAYIQRNIEATRAAFGIDDVEVTPYAAVTTGEAGALREDAETTASIRLLDPTIVSPAFSQLQQNKQYYSFAQSLSVDRYTLDGDKFDTVIAVRELNLDGLGADQRNWVNDHTVYTHGFGVVAAYGNTLTSGGQPDFFEGSIPPSGELTTLQDGYEPRIYFGQESPDYSIVGGSPDGVDWELDFPDDEAGGQVNTTFPTSEVQAGPSLGNPLNRLLFAMKFGAQEILFSGRVTEDSQILYDRDPRDRVQKVAPYLTLDGRVYPAVVDGDVVWMIDGYTTSANYPYSQYQQLEDATTTSASAAVSGIDPLLPQEVNYIRNSVKATVNAYDGSVTLYAWDEEDPVLKAWGEVYPGSLQPLSEISSDLMSHIRYPEDLFKVQRTLLGTYHVDDASEFFSGQDFWQTPPDPVLGTSAPQPPYYLTLQMPTQDETTFSLTSTFIPRGGQRNVLTGFLAANAEAGNEAGKPAADYGQLRLLELPRDSTVPGPGQVDNAFKANAEISRELNLLNQGNSRVLYGNLLTLPVGGGLLYVQPIYVQAASGTQYPRMQKVLVAFGDQIGFADTLSEALDQVFGGDSGADLEEPTTPDVEAPPITDPDGNVVDPDEPGTAEPTDPAAPVEPTEPTTPTDPGESTPEPTEPTTPATGTASEQLATAIADAEAAYIRGEQALADGDWTAYGAAQQDVADALRRANELLDQLDQ